MCRLLLKPSSCGAAERVFNLLPNSTWSIFIQTLTERGTQVGSAMIRHFVRRVNQPESDLTQPSVRRRVIPAPAEVERLDCVVAGDPSVGCASIRGGVRQRGSSQLRYTIGHC